MTMNTVIILILSFFFILFSNFIITFGIPCIKINTVIVLILSFSLILFSSHFIIIIFDTTYMTMNTVIVLILAFSFTLFSNFIITFGTLCIKNEHCYCFHSCFFSSQEPPVLGPDTQ
jgi:hypothetical protein